MSTKNQGNLESDTEPLLEHINGVLVDVSENIQEVAEYSAQKLGGFWDDFQDFVNTGPIVELAIGIVVGNGISDITDSLVQDLLLPPFSFLTKTGIALRNYYWILTPGTKGPPYATLQEAKEDGAVTENIGLFCSKVIEFMVMAFALYWVIKFYARLKRVWESSPEALNNERKKCIWCREKIQPDALKCPFCCSLQAESVSK